MYDGKWIERNNRVWIAYASRWYGPFWCAGDAFRWLYNNRRH